MQFYKMQALGNDFVVFGSPSKRSVPTKELIRFLCDRHYGVGCDCAVFIGASDRYDYFMHVYNPDGFEAEMCGNALRCSAKYVWDRGYFNKRALVAETMSGTRSITLTGNTMCAEIGKASLVNSGTLEISGLHLPYSAVNIGNSHCVVFASNLSDNQFTYLGSAIEHHPIFPEGTNVEFVNIADEHNIEMRVWERGIGETLSCVTGSCAASSAAIDSGYCHGVISVHQPGGVIDVEPRECGNMFVTGNCSIVFKGELLQKQE